MRPLLLIAAGLFVAFGLPPMPDIPQWVWVVPATHADTAVYVYEQRDGGVASGVLSGLNKLNRDGITATLYEDDTVSGADEVPEQYRVPLEAARKAGLPCLVVMGGGMVLRTVANPATEAAIVEAVK